MAGRQEGDDHREAKSKKVMGGQDGDQSAAKMMMGAQEGEIERDEWWLRWLNWDRHDPPSLIDMMSNIPPINNELAMAPVWYWSAVENRDKYWNAIKMEGAVAPVKYRNALEMSMHESTRSWTHEPAQVGDDGNASCYKFKKLYELGATTTYDIPIKRKRTSWPFSQGSRGSLQARDQIRNRRRSVIGGEYREMAPPHNNEEIMRSRSNIRAFAEEMLNLHRMQVINSKKEAASTSTASSVGKLGKSNRGSNTDHDQYWTDQEKEKEYEQLFVEASTSFNPYMEFLPPKIINRFHENDDRAR